MAKSIRSKWRRKCRAVKRVRYGEKELERLKKTLTNDPLNKVKTEAVMSEIQEVANVITIEDIEAETVATPAPAAAGPSDVMDMEEIRKEFNPRTLRDKHGAYPVWVHPRKLKSTKKNKKNNKNKKKLKRNNKK
ncbi:unnamed protein product [Ceutorhynchus assimilis]|uniref:Protein LLP homolog n=1 Tax=Ceutorhynchus assimilis TaxID=467358 RepID=A0A9N9N206_9CUCU|nr:unnamed protein product [Ceutorhynchus assimilis]